MSNLFTTRKFCDGTPACKTCGAQQAEGTIQSCPASRKINQSKSGRQVEGLGDWTERMLASIGVTQERYVAAKEQFGLVPDCNCPKRKEWLNKVSDWWRGQ